MGYHNIDDIKMISKSLSRVIINNDIYTILGILSLSITFMWMIL